MPLWARNKYFVWRGSSEIQNKYICPRCVCRKLNIASSNALYLSSEADIVDRLYAMLKNIYDGQICVLKKPNQVKGYCTLCLGILQDTFLIPFVEKVARTFKTCGYDYGGVVDENIQTNFSLPSALFIREYKFWLAYPAIKNE